MESNYGGDLFQLQQEAIQRARETSQRAVKKPQNKPLLSLNFLSENKDSIIIVAVLAVLLLNGCDDTMLILALALLLLL
jgi:hypothetical protein